MRCCFSSTDDNILVDSAHKLKLGDFGSSRDLSKEHSDVDVSTSPGGEINHILSSILDMLIDEVITLAYRYISLMRLFLFSLLVYKFSSNTYFWQASGVNSGFFSVWS